MLDPKPAYMDPPRIKLYKVSKGVSLRAISKSQGALFFGSLTLLIVVGSVVSIYAYILQIRYKSEKFRCETPFFHNKRDEMMDATTRTPTPTSDIV